jgi:transcriptional regulator with XRE-family HTH domain
MGNITTGERIKRNRIKVGWTQGDLAEKVGVSQMTVSNWEAGKAHPKAEQKAQIFSLLGVAKPAGKDTDEETAVETSEAGPSAVASWLTKTRLERKMSVPELSEAADVTAGQIYNIESGRTTNPRPSTIQKLEKALNERLPPETKAEIKEEATVEGVGEFFEFDPHDKDDWPDVPGIYVLYDISDRPIYVGQGASIRRRIADHEEKFWFKHPIVSTASYISVPDGELRKKIETILIRFLKRNAVINKQNVERG